MSTQTTDPTSLTRTTIQALLAGETVDIDPVECGPYAQYVRTLHAAQNQGGQAQVRWEYSLMQEDLELAILMAGEPPLESETLPPITPNPAPPSGPTLTTPPVRLYLDQSPDDEGNAQCVFYLFQNQFFYCKAYGYLHWNGRYWDVTDAEAKLDRVIVYTLKQRRMQAVQHNNDPVLRACISNAKRVRDCKYLLQSMITIAVEEFDQDPEQLNVANGILNLRTGQLTPPDVEQHFTYCIPIEYDPYANQVMWRQFLTEVIGGGPAVIEYLQQAVGYSITGYTREECLFYIFGPTRAGKGVFTETLLTLLPKPLAVEVDFTTFTARRDQDSQNFDLAPLKPARLIVASESNKYQGLNTGKIKLLTGGNDVRCAFKHRDHFSYRPQYKIWLVSNHPVNADVDDDAAWYRVKVLEFPNSMADREDKTLKQRMREPANLRGVLTWAVEGAMTWLSSAGGLLTPPIVQTTTQKHRNALDYIQVWLDECTTADPLEWSSNEDVYQSYSEWCKANGIKPKEQKGLSFSLKAKGYQIGVARWIGVRTRKGVLGLHVN